MPYLGLFALLIVDASLLGQSMPPETPSEESIEQFEVPVDTKLEVLPFVIEGSVENFDPEERAKELVKTISRKWCGTYSSFKDGSSQTATLLISKVKPIGQIVALQGQLLINGRNTQIRGNLNAKSNQIELIPLSNKWIFDIEPGGIFVGLQGPKRFIFNSPRLTDYGGILDLNKDCKDEISKT